MTHIPIEPGSCAKAQSVAMIPGQRLCSPPCWDNGIDVPLAMLKSGVPGHNR